MSHRERKPYYRQWIKTKQPRQGYVGEAGNSVIAEAIRQAERDNDPGPAINGRVRRATPEEKALVRLKLGQSKPIAEDSFEWEKREVWVVEHNGIVTGALCARQVWQLEPLYLFPEFAEHAPPFTLRAAIVKLLHAFDGWMKARGECWYFCYIEKKPMQRQARSYGMVPVYRKGKMFGKDL